MDKDARSRSRFSSRNKWPPFSASPFKMRQKPEEKVFDVVQLRNTSGGSKPGNARVKGFVTGGGAAWTLLMTNIPQHKHRQSRE